MDEKKKKNPPLQSLAYRKCQLPYVLNYEKSTVDKLIDEGILKGFHLYSGSQMLFSRKRLEALIDKYDGWNDNEYEIGGAA